MKVLVLNGSPKGEDSITAQYLLFLKEVFSDDEFIIKYVPSGKCYETIKEDIQQSDLIVYTSSLYHFSVHAQSMMFLEELKEKYSTDLTGKYFTYLTSSGRIMDITAHSYMKSWIKEVNCNYIQSLSMLDVDLFSEEGKQSLCCWYNYCKAVINKTEKDFKYNNRVILLDATDGNNMTLTEKLNLTKMYCENHNATVEVIALRDYKILPCVSCGGCYTDAKCCLNDNDDYMKLFNRIYNDEDIVITFSEQKYGMLNKEYKVWLDRHVQFGRYPYPAELLRSYLTDGKEDVVYSDYPLHGFVIDSTNEVSPMDSYNFEIHCQAMEFGGALYCGLCQIDDDLISYLDNIIALSNCNVKTPKSFYTQGVYKSFKDLAWFLQKHAPKDYEYFNSKGEYKLCSLNSHIIPVHSAEEGIKMRHSRLTPYKFEIASIKNGTYKFIPKERRYQHEKQDNKEKLKTKKRFKIF